MRRDLTHGCAACRLRYSALLEECPVCEAHAQTLDIAFGHVMRDDLTHGCATCRLRYSGRLEKCPVCNAPALKVDDAIGRIEPTSRVAWVVKWLIVLSALAGVAIVAYTTLQMLGEGWPPKSAMDVLMYPLGALGACLGAGIVIAVPLAVWFGVVKLFGKLLGLVVDRPKRQLRIAIDRYPRQSKTPKKHPMHRLWEHVTQIRRHIDVHQNRYIGMTLGLFIVAQIIAEVFSTRPVVKTSSWSAFAGTFGTIAVINVMAIVIGSFMLGIFHSAIEYASQFLSTPPSLFGYRASAPEVNNDAVIDSFRKGRSEIVGNAVPLTAQERDAVAAHFDTENVLTELKAPLSGKTCFAFRLTGECGDQPVDDADAAYFAIVTAEQKRHVIASSDVTVTIDAKEKFAPGKAVDFLKARGLAFDDAQLREGLLVEGDLVRVTGKNTALHVGSAGYRGSTGERTMLDASDGIPVVIAQG